MRGFSLAGAWVEEHPIEDHAEIQSPWVTTELNPQPPFCTNKAVRVFS